MKGLRFARGWPEDLQPRHLGRATETEVVDGDRIGSEARSGGYLGMDGSST